MIKKIYYMTLLLGGIALIFIDALIKWRIFPLPSIIALAGALCIIWDWRKDK